MPDTTPEAREALDKLALYSTAFGEASLEAVKAVTAALDELSALKRKNGELEAEAAEAAKTRELLLDPAFVWVLMRLGDIAIPAHLDEAYRERQALQAQFSNHVADVEKPDAWEWSSFDVNSGAWGPWTRCYDNLRGYNSKYWRKQAEALPQYTRVRALYLQPLPSRIQSALDAQETK